MAVVSFPWLSARRRGRGTSRRPSGSPRSSRRAGRSSGPGSPRREAAGRRRRLRRGPGGGGAARVRGGPGGGLSWRRPESTARRVLPACQRGASGPGGDAALTLRCHSTRRVPPEGAVPRRQGRTDRLRPEKDAELMAEGEVLGDEGRPGREKDAEGTESEPNEAEHGARIRSGGERRGCSEAVPAGRPSAGWPRSRGSAR